MAKPWKNNDSARTMVNKFNEMVDQINNYEQVSKETEQTAHDIREQLDKKVDKETAKKDLGIDQIDNTPDMNKPLSNPQARAIENATEDMLTSQTTDIEIDGPEPGVIVEIYVNNKKLVITTDKAQVVQKVNVYVKNSKLILITTN